MTQKEQYNNIIKYFIENQSDAKTELDYSTPFELLVAVILSAQCTDKRVNIITKSLFKKYPDALSLKEATIDQIFNIIRSCSYPNNKAKYIIEMAKIIDEKYNNNIPSTLPELTSLPGVGRKTANVILSIIHNIPAMAVDTHVFRVANRIGLTNNSKTPFETEKVLMKNIPTEYVNIAHHWLILHGRYVCTARNPKCKECGIFEYCNFEKKLK